ncbi:MAG: exosortase/archaeosortase family protein [Sulfuricella sp.]
MRRSVPPRFDVPDHPAAGEGREPAAAPDKRGFRRELSFSALFLILFFALQFAYSLTRGSAVETVVIDLATVKPSAAVIGWIAPLERARAQGHRIVSTHGSLSVLNGCEGTESLFLLLAAIFAYPMPWYARLKGAVLGATLIYLLNQVRIVALYFAHRHSAAAFDLLHGYVAPTLIILLASLFFLWWIGRKECRTHGPDASA